MILAFTVAILVLSVWTLLIPKKSTVIAYYMVIVCLMALWQSCLGNPKMFSTVHGQIVSSYVIPNKEIYLLVLEPGASMPEYIAIKWSKPIAEALIEAQNNNDSLFFEKGKISTNNTQSLKDTQPTQSQDVTE